jgi:NADH-quinone oxidoreductase subunit A
MDTTGQISVTLWPFAVYFVAVLVLVAGMLLLSYVLGQRHSEQATGEPYESGIISTGSAHVRFDARFYLVAMFFVIFDLESIFIFAWSVAVRELGWAGYIEMLVFIGILVVVLIYLWRLGALDWGSKRREMMRNRQEGAENHAVVIEQASTPDK